MQGGPYLPTTKVARPPLESILKRTEAIPLDKAGKPANVFADALVGTVKEPELSLSAALDTFWGLARDRIAGKSED